MSIRHIVMWKLVTDDAATKVEHTEQLRAALEGLIPIIPEIQGLTVRQNVLFDGDNFDVVLDSFFENADALATYASHTAHKEAGTIVKALTNARAAVDIQF
jgi:hypothetical protein